jgi:hypothetical protein
MIIILFILSFLVSFLAISLALPGAVELYQRYRRSHFVVCPETQQECGVTISPLVAATSSAIMPTRLHVKECTLWPDRKPCSRRCLWQLRRLTA